MSFSKYLEGMPISAFDGAEDLIHEQPGYAFVE
jgi:hypothetical protein